MRPLMFTAALLASLALPGCGAAPRDTVAVAQTPATAQGQDSVAEQAPTSLWTRPKGDDWPIFLGPTQDSRSEETDIHTKWPAEGLKLVWHKKLGTGYGAPTVAGGRLFQFDRFGDVARLYCLNAATGEELWRHEVPTEYEDLYGYNNGPRCSPVVDGGRVYAFGVDGMLFCCRAEDGKELWRVDTNKAFGVVQNFFGVASNPVVEGDLLLVMVGGSPPESQRVPPGALNRVVPDNCGIVAFDKRTGEVRYKAVDDLASYASLKLATIDGRRWCFAFCREGLAGLDPATGKVDFHFPWRAKILESVNASMPVVVGDEVLISETYGPGAALLKAAPGKCDVVWEDDERRREKSMQTHWMTPVHVEGYLYGSSGRHEYNAVLKCIEWKTGKEMWRQPGMGRTSLTFVDGHFLCLGEFGQLTLVKVNPERYEPVAEIDYADPALGHKLIGERVPLVRPYAWAAPIVSHGLLYVRGDDRLLCLELIPDE